MEDNAKNIDITIELLKEKGIRHFVLSPGGTNMPLVTAVQDDDFFTCYSLVDERSAIYFAIGLYLQTGEPIATSCTSAQATRNYIPGLTEAYYKHVPILAITMAKHPRFTYQEYMQAPDQTSLPRDCVKASYAMPFIRDKNDVYHSIRVANEAVCQLTHDGCGPVQLCIPWLDFPLDHAAPAMKSISIHTPCDLEKFYFGARKILLVIGEHRPFTKEEQVAMDTFCQKHNAVVYKNHLSNFHSPYAVSANLALLTMKPEAFQKIAPDLLITLGGQTGDYPLYKILSRGESGKFEHWRVSSDGKIVDTYDRLTHVFHCTETYFLENAIGDETEDHSYLSVWKHLEENARLDMALPFSNASIAQYLHSRIPENSALQFSILNTLRIWDLFSLPQSVRCFSNVGAFGIDGGLSTLIGQSVVTDDLCFMIIGDLAFYYDMNSIGIRHIKNNLRILLVNNNGGVEFKYHRQNMADVNRYIAAGDHFKNARGWAETCGFRYLSADSMDAFLETAPQFLGESLQPVLLEVFVSDQDEVAAYQRIVDANTVQTAGESVKNSIKSSVKNVLGEKGVKQLKKLVKK